MVQNLSNEMDVALAQTTTFLCRVWELTLANGEVYRFTDLTRDVVYDGQTWKYDPGIRVSSIVISSGGQPDNAQIEVTTAAQFLSQNRIRQGSLKSATFNMWAIDWRDPDLYGPIPLFSGGTGTTKFNNKGKVDIGLNSDVSGGASKIGELYSRQCRAQLGDARCKVNIEALKIGFTIDTITDNGYGFTATEMFATSLDHFKFGKVVWTAGLNDTLQDEIKANVPGEGRVVLSLYPRNPLVVGDTGFAYPGCDFQVQTCGNRFANLANYRGEPYVPPPNITIFSGLALVQVRAGDLNYMQYAPTGVSAGNA